jgi:hypothetical protein
MFTPHAPNKVSRFFFFYCEVTCRSDVSKASAAMYVIYIFFWDVTQRTLIVTDVSGVPISSIGRFNDVVSC